MAAHETPPVVAAALQGGVQFGLQHLLDEAADALANRPFQRVEPILIREWPRRARCGSLVHGVISWRLAGRPLGSTPIRRLRRPQIPTTSATRPTAALIQISQVFQRAIPLGRDR
jgi:hypothetical protein